MISDQPEAYLRFDHGRYPKTWAAKVSQATASGIQPKANPPKQARTPKQISEGDRERCSGMHIDI